MLRKEFMKYLKEYRLFESDVTSSYMLDGIKDRLIDLEDLGRIKTSIKANRLAYTDYNSLTLSNVFQDELYLSFHLSNHLDYDGFLFEEISFYVFWLKEYLDVNFKSCRVLFTKNKYYGLRTRTEINLENKEDLIKLEENRIEDLIIFFINK